MIRRTVVIDGAPARLSLRHLQLVVERDGTITGTVPVEDLGVLVVDHPGVAYTQVPFGWKTVWLLAHFDLPTETKQQRRAYVRFRKDLLNDGFSMMQYSVYQRHCASPENAQAHVERMGKRVPAEGEVRFLVITDRQYSRIVTYWGKKRQVATPAPAQLEFF